MRPCPFTTVRDPGAEARGAGALLVGIWDDDAVESQTVEFRARSGRILTIAVGVLCAVAFVATLLEDPVVGLRYLPALALPAVLVWAVLGRPAVLVDDSGVELRNVLRTVHLPWPSILRSG